MKVNLYSIKLKEPGTFVLPKEFSGETNEPLLAQAIHVYRDRTHKGTSKVKTRSAVALTTAKWYRQKGTGRARHGAQSAPIFVGGGVAHGPKGVKRILELPKKMRRKALFSALSFKAKDHAVVAVGDLEAIKKSKEAMELVSKVRSGENFNKGKILLAVSEKNSGVYRYFKNVAGVNVEKYSDLNAYKVYLGGRLVLDVDSFLVKKGKSK